MVYPVLHLPQLTSDTVIGPPDAAEKHWDSCREREKKNKKTHQHRSCNTKRRPNRTVSIQIHQLPPLQLFQVAARPSTKLLSINGADSPLAAAMTLRSGAREADPTVPPSTVLYKRKGVIKRAQMAGYLPWPLSAAGLMRKCPAASLDLATQKCCYYYRGCCGPMQD